MTAQWTNLDKGTWDSVYANGDGIKVPTQRRTPGQLWEREAERADEREASCGYDDVTGEPYPHDIHPDGDCRYCGRQIIGDGPKLTQLGFTANSFAAIVRNGETVSVGSIL